MGLIHIVFGSPSKTVLLAIDHFEDFIIVASFPVARCFPCNRLA